MKDTVLSILYCSVLVVEICIGLILHTLVLSVIISDDHFVKYWRGGVGAILGLAPKRDQPESGFSPQRVAGEWTP